MVTEQENIMILTNHIQERMSQRGFNKTMVNYMVDCGQIDYEKTQYILNRYSKSEIINEIEFFRDEIRETQKALSEAKQLRKLMYKIN